MNNQKIESPPHKRSSLRNNSIMTPEQLEIIKKKKRQSVNWIGEINVLNEKKKTEKISLTPVNKSSVENKNFVEARRRSVHNEFKLVKELLKNKNFEDDDDDETISKEEIEKTEKNTKLNVEVGKNMSDNDTDENEE